MVARVRAAVAKFRQSVQELWQWLPEFRKSLQGSGSCSQSSGSRCQGSGSYCQSSGNHCGSRKNVFLFKIHSRAAQSGWVKGGFDALYIEVDRDGTGFKFLALDTEPDYVDTAALPANTTQWKYRATYILHDEKVGLRSDEVSVAVKA